MASVIGLGIGSLWYGAWFPDAQAELQQRLSIEAKRTVSKPDFWTVSTDGLSLRTPVPLTFVSLILTLLGGIGSVAAAFRLSDLELKENEFKREQESHAETQQYYYDSIHDHLVRLFASKLSCFDESCRASVYRYDGESHLLRMVFRYAPFSRYESKGRVAFAAGEGFAGAVLAAGEHLFASFAEKPGSPKYCREVNLFLKNFDTSIDSAVIARLRMKSYCYFGFSIRDVESGQKFAVLVLECVKKGRLDQDEILRVFADQKNQMAKYVKHIVALDSQLNPFGRAG